jgi:hypothetical protein
MFKFKGITLILLLLFLSICYSSSVHADQWAKLFGSTVDDSEDYADSIQQTSDGGYIVGGSKLWKLDGSGNWVWQKSYGGRTKAIQQTSDGGYIVACDALVLKLDGDGQVVWQKTYVGSGTDHVWIESIQQTSDGGYIAAGGHYPFGADVDAWVLKLDGTGNVVWQKAYDNVSRNDSVFFVRQTSDEGYIVAVESRFNGSFDSNPLDIWILKLDGSGQIVWQKTYDNGTGDRVSSIQQTSDGGYIMAGTTVSPGTVYDDVWVLKLDGNGTVIWERTYGGSNNDLASSVQQTADGGFIVAGHTISFGSYPYFDVWLLKLSGTGNVVWQKTYDIGQDDRASSVQQTSDGGFIVAGSTYGGDDDAYFYSEAWVLKLDENGGITNCPIIATSTATVNDTSAIVSDTNATGVNTTASQSTSTATVVDAIVPEIEVCYYVNPGLPNIWVSPTNNNFKQVVAGGSSTKTITVSNTGYIDLTIGSMTITGTNADQFSILNDFCSGQTLIPSSSCTVDVRFSPASLDAKSAYLNIPSNDPDTPLKNVPLSGRGAKVVVISPNGGETLKSGTVHTITWQTSTIVGSVATTRIYYRYKGKPLRLIASLPGNPGSHPWSVPVKVNPKRAKVKVVLKDAAGNTLASDMSDSFFKIIP